MSCPVSGQKKHTLLSQKINILQNQAPKNRYSEGENKCLLNVMKDVNQVFPGKVDLAC